MARMNQTAKMKENPNKKTKTRLKIFKNQTKTHKFIKETRNHNLKQSTLKCLLIHIYLSAGVKTFIQPQKTPPTPAPTPIIINQTMKAFYSPSEFQNIAKLINMSEIDPQTFSAKITKKSSQGTITLFLKDFENVSQTIVYSQQHDIYTKLAIASLMAEQPDWASPSYSSVHPKIPFFSASNQDSVCFVTRPRGDLFHLDFDIVYQVNQSESSMLVKDQEHLIPVPIQHIDVSMAECQTAFTYFDIGVYGLVTKVLQWVGVGGQRGEIFNAPVLRLRSDLDGQEYLNADLKLKVVRLSDDGERETIKLSKQVGRDGGEGGKRKGIPKWKSSKMYDTQLTKVTRKTFLGKEVENEKIDLFLVQHSYGDLRDNFFVFSLNSSSIEVYQAQGGLIGIPFLRTSDTDSGAVVISSNVELISPHSALSFAHYRNQSSQPNSTDQYKFGVFLVEDKTNKTLGEKGGRPGVRKICEFKKLSTKRGGRVDLINNNTRISVVSIEPFNITVCDIDLARSLSLISQPSSPKNSKFRSKDEDEGENECYDTFSISNCVERALTVPRNNGGFNHRNISSIVGVNNYRKEPLVDAFRANLYIESDDIDGAIVIDTLTINLNSPFLVPKTHSPDVSSEIYKLTEYGIRYIKIFSKFTIVSKLLGEPQIGVQIENDYLKFVGTQNCTVSIGDNKKRWEINFQKEVVTAYNHFNVTNFYYKEFQVSRTSYPVAYNSEPILLQGDYIQSQQGVGGISFYDVTLNPFSEVLNFQHQYFGKVKNIYHPKLSYSISTGDALQVNEICETDSFKVSCSGGQLDRLWIPVHLPSEGANQEGNTENSEAGSLESSYRKMIKFNMNLHQYNCAKIICYENGLALIRNTMDNISGTILSSIKNQSSEFEVKLRYVQDISQLAPLLGDNKKLNVRVMPPKIDYPRLVEFEDGSTVLISHQSSYKPEQDVTESQLSHNLKTADGDSDYNADFTSFKLYFDRGIFMARSKSDYQTRFISSVFFEVYGEQSAFPTDASNDFPKLLSLYNPNKVSVKAIGPIDSSSLDELNQIDFDRVFNLIYGNGVFDITFGPVQKSSTQNMELMAPGQQNSKSSSSKLKVGEDKKLMTIVFDQTVEYNLSAQLAPGEQLGAIVRMPNLSSSKTQSLDQEAKADLTFQLIIGTTNKRIIVQKVKSLEEESSSKSLYINQKGYIKRKEKKFEAAGGPRRSQQGLMHWKISVISFKNQCLVMGYVPNLALITAAESYSQDFRVFQQNQEDSTSTTKSTNKKQTQFLNKERDFQRYQTIENKSLPIIKIQQVESMGSVLLTFELQKTEFRQRQTKSIYLNQATLCQKGFTRKADNSRKSTKKVHDLPREESSQTEHNLGMRSTLNSYSALIKDRYLIDSRPFTDFSALGLTNQTLLVAAGIAEDRPVQRILFYALNVNQNLAVQKLQTNGISTISQAIKKAGVKKTIIEKVSLKWIDQAPIEQNRTAEMVLIGSQQNIIVVKLAISFNPKSQSINLQAKEVEVFKNPTAAQDLVCDTTQDYMFCVIRGYDAHKNSTDDLQKSSVWFVVWEKNGLASSRLRKEKSKQNEDKKIKQYPAQGGYERWREIRYSYRIETLNIDFVEGAATILDYESNQIALIKAMDDLDASVIVTRLNSSVKIRFNDPELLLRETNVMDGKFQLMTNPWYPLDNRILLFDTREIIRPDFGVEGPRTLFEIIFMLIAGLGLGLIALVWILLFKPYQKFTNQRMNASFQSDEDITMTAF